jgi:hypothetical protein
MDVQFVSTSARRFAMTARLASADCHGEAMAVRTPWFTPLRTPYFVPGHQMPGMPTKPGKDLMRCTHVRTLG